MIPRTCRGLSAASARKQGERILTLGPCCERCKPLKAGALVNTTDLLSATYTLLGKYAFTLVNPREVPHGQVRGVLELAGGGGDTWVKFPVEEAQWPRTRSPSRLTVP